MIHDNRIHFSDQTLFKIKNGESITIPDTTVSASPTGLSSGVSPTTTFDARKAAVGGATFATFNDAAGPAASLDLHVKLSPGDVLACSAVVSNVITVTLTPAGGVAETVGLIASVTTSGGVIGFYA